MPGETEEIIEVPQREEQANFVQTFQEIARGERTAAALEHRLSTMEAKLDALLAEAEQRQAEIERARDGGSDQPSTNDEDKHANHNDPGSSA